MLEPSETGRGELDRTVSNGRLQRNVLTLALARAQRTRARARVRFLLTS